MSTQNRSAHILAKLAFLAFIIIQIAPAWVKIDYSLTDTPCPLHAIRANNFGHPQSHHIDHDHADHAALMNESEQLAFLELTGRTPYDPEMLCIPGMHVTNTTKNTSHSDHHDHSHEHDDQQNKPWACPYCSVREMAFTPVDYIYVTAPQFRTLPFIVAAYQDALAHKHVKRSHHARAPPFLS